MTERQRIRQCVLIWVLLVVFLLIAVGSSVVPMPTWLLLAIIFGTAAVKALLVALYYMHLRFEQFAVSLFALIPFLLFVILTLALFPDFVVRR